MMVIHVKLQIPNQVSSRCTNSLHKSKKDFRVVKSEGIAGPFCQIAFIVQLSTAQYDGEVGTVGIASSSILVNSGAIIMA